ncbi:MAG TPA: hypothetical protein EYQ82_07605 [Dehalococcoidia bacterium]|nr:hypothetical protein [Dehalococcoidia bacterium]
MRSQLEYFIDGEGIVNINVADAGGTSKVCPEAGIVVEIAYTITSAATTVPHTFDVMKNNQDTGVDALLPVTLQGGGGLMNLTGQVEVADNDIVRLISNGETGNTPDVYFTWIIRR